MNFSLTDDQQSVLLALDGLLAGAEPITQHTSNYQYSNSLATALGASGFLDIAREEDFSLLDAVLIAERIAREPYAAEAAVSALVGPLIPETRGRRLAIVSGDHMAPIRFLPMADLLVIDHGDHATINEIEKGSVRPVETLLAYPYGNLSPEFSVGGRRFDDVASLRRRWQIAISAEAAGCMAAALAVVVDHVTNRYAFGKPLGSLQAVQHRLAMGSETVESSRWLTLRAGWSDDPIDAALAAGFAQSRVAGFTYDMHQFCGAMGLTLEFPLHLWTYRLRALVSELGGPSVQSRNLAQLTWGVAQ